LFLERTNLRAAACHSENRTNFEIGHYVVVCPEKIYRRIALILYIA